MLGFFGSGCASIPLATDYIGPAERPPDLEAYYSVGSSYSGYRTEVLEDRGLYVLRRIEFKTEYGPITIDYFKRRKLSDDLILVFPVLGGRNLFSGHFADYFARRGFDTAIVHRDKEFKNPDNYEHLEQIFRRNVIRDRIAMDFFEREFGKKDFASFGISRGAINAAVTAGVDERLRFNVLALGGSDIISLFRESGERGMREYRRKVMARKGITEQQFYEFLYKTIKTDPKWVAPHINARDTLMFLSVFDDSVPIEYGLKLRRRIGYPRTIFLVSGHYSAVAYTQFVALVPPSRDFSLFPLDYVETEALTFYRQAFLGKPPTLRHRVFQVLRAPFQVIGQLVDLFNGEE